MDEPERIRWLTEQVDRRIPKHIVELLRTDQYFENADEDGGEELLRRTRYLLQWNPTPMRPRSAPSDKTIRLLAKSEEMRRDALSEHWAKDASRQPEARQFRSAVLGGRLLTADEAYVLLRSPAGQMFASEELSSAGVDPARHTAEIVREEAKVRGPYHAVVRVKKPRTDLSFSRSNTARSVWTADRPLGDETFKIRNDERLFDVNCWSGSTLDELRRASTRLEARRYPWNEHAAPWFLLTGETPLVPAISHRVDLNMGSRGTRAVIELRIEPWISVERVADLYKRLQDHVIGGHNRPVSERRIVLFRFVTERSDEEGAIPSWRSLMAVWNEQYSKWKYDNVRNFSRDYWAGARAVVFPKYRPFWSPELKDVKARER